MWGGELDLTPDVLVLITTAMFGLPGEVWDSLVSGGLPAAPLSPPALAPGLLWEGLACGG